VTSEGIYLPGLCGCSQHEVAYGHKDISLSDGTPLKVPTTLRKVLRSQMWREYRDANKDPESGSVHKLHVVTTCGHDIIFYVVAIIFFIICYRCAL
jgi:hypothetical protein